MLGFPIYARFRHGSRNAAVFGCLVVAIFAPTSLASAAGAAPFVHQGEKLTGAGEVGEGDFGLSVALSSNGNTALVGAAGSNENVGAAWVYNRSGAAWAQGETLVGKGEVGKGFFGGTVALSGDGNTVIVGGGIGGGDWVFTRSGSTWTEQQELSAGSEGGFGGPAALSSDGNTAVVGGAEGAWVFTRSGSTWAQQGGKLQGSGAIGEPAFGNTIALSGDGKTALIGGEADNKSVGAAWVFTRSGSTWTQQGPKLTGTEEEEFGTFGVSVALSENGNTALVGGNGTGEGYGAAWAFSRSGSTWSQQQKLTGGGERPYGTFGSSVALSSDGNTALIGGPSDSWLSEPGLGAAWVFARSGSEWSQRGEKFRGRGEVGAVRFGDEVALSGDASTALIGGAADNNNVGAAWPFAVESEAEAKEREAKEREAREREAKEHEALGTSAREASAREAAAKEAAARKAAEEAADSRAEGEAALHATVKIIKFKVTGKALLVTVSVSRGGSLLITGPGLAKTAKTLAAGSHVVAVPLTKTGKAERARRRRIKVVVVLRLGAITHTVAAAIKL